MCYSHFNDMDADVITIENSRSDEKFLSVFRDGVKYGAGIGTGVYDIHSPRIPSTEEIADRIIKMLAVLAGNILWVNRDCALEPLIIIIIIIIIIMFLPFILSKDM